MEELDIALSPLKEEEEEEEEEKVVDETRDDNQPKRLANKNASRI
jgi:hypothetical protein